MQESYKMDEGKLKNIVKRLKEGCKKVVRNC